MKYTLALMFDNDTIITTDKFNAPTNKEACVQANNILKEYFHTCVERDCYLPSCIGIIRCHGKKQRLIRIWNCNED